MGQQRSVDRSEIQTLAPGILLDREYSAPVVVIKLADLVYHPQRKSGPSSAHVEHQFVKVTVRVHGPFPQFGKLVDHVWKVVCKVVDGRNVLEVQHEADCIAAQRGWCRAFEARTLHVSLRRKPTGSCTHLDHPFKWPGLHFNRTTLKGKRASAHRQTHRQTFTRESENSNGAQRGGLVQRERKRSASWRAK